MNDQVSDVGSLKEFFQELAYGLVFYSIFSNKME